MSNDSPAAPAKLSKLAMAAVLVAFLIAAGNLLLGFRQPLAALAATVLPITAGFGILRKRIWAAYGFALLLFGQAVFALLLLRGQNAKAVQLAIALLFFCALCSLFFFAGRSLARSGGKPGYAAAWIAVACLVTLPFAFLRAFVIPTGSMENTLLIGDRIFVRVFPQGHFRRGDLVAYRFPLDRKETSIKRLIGMPGDRIRIVSRTVLVNGSVLSEPYVIHKFRTADRYRDNLPVDPGEIGRWLPSAVALAARDMFVNHVANGEVVVPAAKYFVLGDNRDNSLDSRYWGFLDAADIIGKPLLIFDSEQPAEKTNKFSAPNIRWNRMFKFL